MSKADLLGSKPSVETLAIRQNYSLGAKVIIAEQRIREWYEYWKGQVYVAFSGGKDSTVLLHIVRSLYPDVPAVFSDTGLEFPEIRDFVKTIDNVVWVRPKMPFTKVIEKYGYPVISKKIAMGFDRIRNTPNPDVQIPLRLHGGINPTSGKKQFATIPKKWQYLLNAPFKISDKCCDVMKKNPIHTYERESKRKPFIGTMASDSDQRKQNYLKNGCNAFNLNKPLSTPLSIWKEQDVWAYVKKFNIPVCPIYALGYDRTGCVFCAFGCHMEESNRFEKLKETHPKLYNYCMDKLGMREVLKWYPKRESEYEYEDAFCDETCCCDVEKSGGKILPPPDFLP